MLIIQFHLFGSANECKEANNNAEEVESCPRTKEEWDIAALKKNCRALAAEAEGKICTDNEKQPEYHCLINPFKNKYLEVCVVAKIIFGYCAEYDEFGNVIQHHYGAKCENVFPKCDDPYKSTDAYKYPDCYKLVKKTNGSRESGDPEISYDKTKIIITTCTVVVLLCCLVAVITLYCIQKRKEKRKKDKNREERQCLPETAPKNTNNKEAVSMSFIQYFHCETKKLQHLLYYHDNIKKCEQRIVEKMQIKNDFTNVVNNVVTKDGFVKIGVIGKFTDEDLLLFPRGRTITRHDNEQPLNATPVLCFQHNMPLQSALEACHREGACHLIFIKPVRDVEGTENDSVIFTDRNKENILEAITSCLEQPLSHMLEEWLDIYSEDTEIHSEIKAVLMMTLNHNDETDTPKVPDNIQTYLSGKSDIQSYRMLTNSTLEIFVTKTTDEKKLRNELKELDEHFYKKCLVQIEKRKSIKRNTGSVVKEDDTRRNITSPTRSLNSSKQNETASIGMNPNIHQQDDQKCEKSVCVEIMRYEDAVENSKSKLNYESLNSINSISSNENSDDSQKLDFDNKNKF